MTTMWPRNAARRYEANRAALAAHLTTTGDPLAVVARPAARAAGRAQRHMDRSASRMMRVDRDAALGDPALWQDTLNRFMGRLTRGEIRRAHHERWGEARPWSIRLVEEDWDAPELTIVAEPDPYA